jgi:hypothetical protein
MTTVRVACGAGGGVIRAKAIVDASNASITSRYDLTVCYSATQTFAIESGMIGGTLQTKWRGQSVSALHWISQLRVSPPGAAAVTQTCSALQPSDGHGSPSPCVEIWRRAPSVQAMHPRSNDKTVTSEVRICRAACI